MALCRSLREEANEVLALAEFSETIYSVFLWEKSLIYLENYLAPR